MDKYKKSLVNILSYFAKLKIVIISILVFVFLGLTILDAQKAGDTLRDEQLINTRVTELEASRVRFNDDIVEQIKARTDEQKTPNTNTTKNPFFYGN